MNENELEEMAWKAASNFGETDNMWHPDYGWILKNGELTEVGIQWYEKEILDKEIK